MFNFLNTPFIYQKTRENMHKDELFFFVSNNNFEFQMRKRLSFLVFSMVTTI